MHRIRRPSQATICLTVAGALLLTAQMASAEEVKAGEVWVTLVGSDYAKPFLDGVEYEDHEFENNGFKLVIRLEDVTVVRTFELRPSSSELAPYELTTDPKEFKPRRVPGEKARRLAQIVTAKFQKAPKEDPAKDPEEPKPDETKPDEPKPDETKPGETKPGEPKPDETKPDKPNTDEPKPGKPAKPEPTREDEPDDEDE